jgi:hypothetical protein
MHHELTRIFRFLLFSFCFFFVLGKTSLKKARMNTEQPRPGNQPPSVGNPAQMVPPQAGVRPVNIVNAGGKES